MERYIALLRGINVSGRNMIKMEALRKLFESLGYLDPVTYLQSGNVIFSADPAPDDRLAARLSDAIRQAFGYEVPVMVLTPERLSRIAAENPLTEDKALDPAFFHVTLLNGNPGGASLDKALQKRAPDEEIRLGTGAVYLYCPGGYGNTKLHNAYLEGLLGVTATTRNWKTIGELISLSGGHWDASPEA